MCKCCQSILEACYWHLIEKRFCYDESIALYEVPEKEEKNNNMFDNMAFYDSVAVIAGRAIVTIDPLPEENKPIVQQPLRRLRWQEEPKNFLNNKFISKSVPVIYEETALEELAKKEDDNTETDKDNEKSNSNISLPSQTTVDGPIKNDNKSEKPSSNIKSSASFPDPEIEHRHKSLRERRMSKSLYLKIDQPKELPLIRQQSMPKFYLDTPEENQTSMVRVPSMTLTSPVPTNSSGFVFDLYSVVQMERARVHNLNQATGHRDGNDKASRLLQIKDKIKLMRSKSSLGQITNLPHAHQHI